MKLNDALYVALRVAGWTVPRLPLWFTYALAMFAGRCAYYLFPGPRANIVRNLSIVLGVQPDSREVRSAARRAFENDAKNWIDTLRIARLTPDDIVNLVHVDGWEHLKSGLASRSGIVLVSLHLGNFDLVGQVLSTHGYRVTIPVERMRPERLFQFLMRERRSKGINAVPLDRGALKEMLQALRRGEIVAIAGDRNLGGRGVQVPFFGREAVMPRGPASFARHTGATVLVGFGVRLAGDRFRGSISAPVEMVKSEDPDRDDRENTARIAAVLEGLIRRYPEQWLMFSPVWSALPPHAEARDAA